VCLVFVSSKRIAAVKAFAKAASAIAFELQNTKSDNCVYILDFYIISPEDELIHPLKPRFSAHLEIELPFLTFI